jgi:HPt (histidine-containing phosphotransfer) domain-containing protein
VADQRITPEMLQATPADQATDQGAGAGTGQVGAEGAAGQATQAAPWDAAELPGGHPYADKGFKSIGDLDRAYRSSSDEAHRLRTDLDRSEAQRQLLFQFLERTGRAPQPSPAAEPQREPGVPEGFRTRAEWDAAYAADPLAALSRMQEATFERLIGQRLAPVAQRQQQVDAVLADQREQALTGQIAAQAKALQTADPRFRAGTPEMQMYERFIDENPEIFNSLVSALAAGKPVNVPQRIWQMALADLQAGQLQAANERLEDKRARAGVATPGGGGAATMSAPKNLKEAIAQTAAQLRQQGIQVAEADEEAVTQALAKHGFR